MAARSGTCAMCAAGWEGGEEADWRGDVGCTAGGGAGKGAIKKRTAPSVPKWSPISVLTGPDQA